MYVWWIENFVIKSDIFRGFFICKNILNKIIVLYHDNYFKYFMFGKYNGFVSKARGFCMHVFSSLRYIENHEWVQIISLIVLTEL
jgi:hypothetical protein